MLEAIAESDSRKDYLVDRKNSSNGACVSDSEGWETFSCSCLKDEESLVLVLEKKEEEVSKDSRNDGPHIQDVVDNWRRERAREIINKRCLTLGFHNGVIQVMPHIWAFP